MANDFFTDSQKKLIVEAIREAELNTSGEIQVHIEKRCKDNIVLDRAAKVFSNLNMHRTKLRNGVLFYLAIEDKKFAILGDQGINNKVADNFWNAIKDNMEKHFRAGQFTEGLCEGIKHAGIQLKQNFPISKDDKNELPDDISFGSN